VLALAPAAPNPFRSVTRLRYTLPAAGRVGLTVFDVRGRQVRALRSEVEPAGAHTAEWDGRDDAGHPVASGPYFLRLSQAGRKTSEAVVRIQ
jgi:flagellar hook assembly protein FlgD